jgi:phosphoribosyl 1,2-cyclic phosphodiesterase
MCGRASFRTPTDSDHAGHVKEYTAVPVYASQGTLSSFTLKQRVQHNQFALRNLQRVQIGPFSVLPFSVQHDAKEPLGFVITHPECGNVLFATDTYYVEYTFSQLSNILIECNYSAEILERNVLAGKVSPAQRSRTLQSHMSYESCLQMLKSNDLSNVNSIVLIHLSDLNSHAEEFREGIQRATGKNVHVAAKGMTISFNKTPF